MILDICVWNHAVATAISQKMGIVCVGARCHLTVVPLHPIGKILSGDPSLCCPREPRFGDATGRFVGGGSFFCRQLEDLG